MEETLWDSTGAALCPSVGKGVITSLQEAMGSLSQPAQLLVTRGLTYVFKLLK